MQFVASIIGFTGVPSVGTFLSRILNRESKPVPRPRYGPCMKNEGLNSVFDIEQANGTCNEKPVNYDLIYINPANNPLDNENLIVYNSSASLPNGFRGTVRDFNANLPSVPKFLDQTQYWPMILSKSPTALSSLVTSTGLGNVFGPIASLGASQGQIINVCPQCYVVDPVPVDPKIQGSTFSTFLSLPMLSAQDAGENNATNSSLIILPGLSTAPQGENGINVPCVFTETPVTAGVPNSAQNIYSTGLATELYLVALKDTTFFMELNGAFGGQVFLYPNGVDPTNKLPVRTIVYEGGQPGTVYGLYTLKQYDVLKVFLGSPGDDSSQWNNPNVYSFDGNGQGGQGTMFGGTNGGGASYAVHYKLSAFNTPGVTGFDQGPLLQALNNSSGTLVCVAGGGGGASRNASGGSAGLNAVPSIGNVPLSYGSRNLRDGRDTSAFGSSGSKTNVTGLAAENRSRGTQDFSGGGGAQTVGGASNVPNQINNGAQGSRLQPFLGNTSSYSGSGGGSATATDIGSGGGGGGGGLFGGGAGGFNGQSKPTNLHGAGGGGSSWQGLLKKTSRENISMNAYRSTNLWPVPNTSYDFGTLNQSASRYGSLILGWPRA